MEARIARLESDVAHLRSDVGEIKVDLRAMRDRMDSQMEVTRDKMDSLSAKMDSQMGVMRDKIDSTTMTLLEKIDGVKASLAAAKVWALILYFALAGSMLGAMARGFGWL